VQHGSRCNLAQRGWVGDSHFPRQEHAIAGDVRNVGKDIEIVAREAKQLSRQYVSPAHERDDMAADLLRQRADFILRKRLFLQVAVDADRDAFLLQVGDGLLARRTLCMF